MNIPALSARTIQRDVAKSNIITGSEIQVPNNVRT